MVSAMIPSVLRHHGFCNVNVAIGGSCIHVLPFQETLSQSPRVVDSPAKNGARDEFHRSHRRFSPESITKVGIWAIEEYDKSMKKIRYETSTPNNNNCIIWRDSLQNRYVLELGHCVPSRKAGWVAAGSLASPQHLFAKPPNSPISSQKVPLS